MTLLRLKNGQTARVKHLNPECENYHRFLELGFTPGEAVTVLRRAPLGGPLQVKIRDTHFAIGRVDAGFIHID